MNNIKALRECYSAGPESLIVLDKLLYLRESNKFKTLCEVIRIFDPVKSPRSYAYIAIK